MARLRVTRSISRTDLEAAAKDEFLHSLAGGLVGLLCLAVGAYLISAWLFGPISTIALPVPGSTEGLHLPAGIAGALAVFVGATVIWITRPTVTD